MDERPATLPVSLDVLTAVHTILSQCSLLTSPARHVEEGQDLPVLLKRSSEAVMKLSKRLHGEKQYQPPRPAEAALKVLRGEAPTVAARLRLREQSQHQSARPAPEAMGRR
jgi:hypothetical protein